MVDKVPQARPTINTMCHECKGSKIVWRPRSYVGAGGVTGTMTQEVTCPACKGKGMFPGLQPPV